MLLLTGVLLAAPQEAIPGPTVLRWDEDYAGVAELDSDDWRARFKDVPFGQGGRWRVSTGIELRSQAEWFRGDGPAPDADIEYVWWRALPVVEVRDDRWRAFVQGIFAYETGVDGPLAPIDADKGDLLQAFGEYSVPAGGAHWTVRGGRRLLVFGSQRLVATRYGPNVPQAFDGVTFEATWDSWSVESLWTRPAAVEPGALDDEPDSNEALYGVYATRAVGDGGLDLYWLGHEDERADFDQGLTDQVRHTFGARYFGRRGAFDWNWELFGQVGDYDGGDIAAWSLATDTGYRIAGLPYSPRVYFRAAVISGDDDPNDDRLGTFDPLYPRGKYFGEINLFGPSNLVNSHLGTEIEVGERWLIEAGVNAYWRESIADGIYDNAGNLVRSGANSDERFIGTQADLLLTYEPVPSVTLNAGYSVFEAGDFIEESGSSETVHFFQLALRFWF